MDFLSTLVTAVLGILTLVLLYVVYMSRKYLIFKKLGVKHLTPWPGVGSFPAISKHGFVGFHKMIYKQFENEKMYGFFEAGRPILVIKDLDLLKNVMVKNFNSFVNRRVFAMSEPMNSALTQIEDEQWRHVRNTVSPTFSSGKLKRMSLLVEQTTKSLTSNLREACRSGKEIELKHVVSCYTLDVIANTGFGVSIDSLNDETSPFVTEAKKLINFGDSAVAFLFLFPVLLKILTKMGHGIFPKSATKFFTDFCDAALHNRKEGESSKDQKKRNDFIQLMVDQEQNENGSGVGDETEKKGLTYLEIQGQAFIFILAGYDTVSTALSFAMFLLAHNHDILSKLQEELDEVLQGKFPNYDNVNSLVYLDMCMNEAMRLYPPGFIIDRVCTQDCEIDGVTIPKGMTIVIPFIGIYTDPKIFPDPDKFDPERFSPENKASRHPFAFLPFGQGPRNCIGMRLALIEMKIAMAAILQEMTPIPCSKTVNPPKLSRYQLKAEDGLWVKFVSRKEE